MPKVFVYGTLLKRMQRSSVLNNSLYCGLAMIQADLYNLGSYPDQDLLVFLYKDFLYSQMTYQFFFIGNSGNSSLYLALLRLLLINLENNSLCSMGSNCVIPRQYAIREPAAEL